MHSKKNGTTLPIDPPMVIAPSPDSTADAQPRAGLLYVEPAYITYIESHFQPGKMSIVTEECRPGLNKGYSISLRGSERSRYGTLCRRQNVHAHMPACEREPFSVRRGRRIAPLIERACYRPLLAANSKCGLPEAGINV